MARRLGVEADAAHVELGLERGHRALGVERPQLDARVVRAGGQQAHVGAVEVHRPAALVVLLQGARALPRGGVPHGHGALVVGRRQHVLVVRVPRHARDLVRALHLGARVVHVHRVAHHALELEHLPRALTLTLTLTRVVALRKAYTAPRVFLYMYDSHLPNRNAMNV